ncbi:ROK family transcriptional regulator [Micromonospora sp. NBC_00898]|uniref:ROK family transcriptional regulator n=1 Tax=Micromonospora sp. NBC_00898 TaxID=2975981 RepID=UPI00386F6541|nr:ROK family transcriptional regulator [Micromonospora sp. NBC_00898]
MDPAKPAQDLARALTDERVLRALMRERRLTRAELAARIGISKPTAGESVRRLTELGLVADTGERTPGGRGRGRVGSYYALAADVGAALAVSIAPEGVVAERVDVYGDIVCRAERRISRPAQPAQVAAALRIVAAETHEGAGRPPRLAVVSAADPVDRATGRLTQLPDAPFLIGELDPVDVLAPHVHGPVTVDNDVNWAAQAEREHDGLPLDDFAYLFLGEGLGCAIVNDGEVRRGGTGLAGEIAHLVTIGPHGRAMPLVEVFDALGLRQSRSTAIDVDRLLTAATAATSEAMATRHALGRAVSGVLAAVVALTDPKVVVIGGGWGSNPVILDTIRTTVAAGPRHVPVRAAEVTVEPALAGARTDALHRLRSAVVAAGRRTAPDGTDDHRPPADLIA